MNVPQLRFKEFGGDWDLKKLGEFAELTSSKRVYLSDYVNEGIPFYRGKEISELKRNETPKDILYITKNAYEQFKLNFGVPQINDILITAVGTLGNVYRIQNNEAFYFKDGNLIWLRNIQILSAFLEILLETNQEAIQKSSIGSTQRALTIVELKKLKFKIPPLPEQTKIANFLTTIDERINQLTRKKELMTQYKQGVMQQIFSQQLRFKDDNGEDFPDWVMLTLNDVSQFLDSRRKPIKESERAKIKGEYPYYGASGVIDFVKDYIFDEDIILLGEDGENIISRNLPLAFKVTGKCWVNNHAHVIKPNLDTHIDFLTQYLESISYLEYNTGTAQPKLNQEICRKIPVPKPIFPEQTKIANFLTALDKQLQHITQQIEATKQYKQGLLQQMFV